MPNRTISSNRTISLKFNLDAFDALIDKITA